MAPTVRRTRLALPLLALALAATPAGAATWSAPQSLSVPGAPAGDPRVGVDGAGGAVAIWRGGDGTVQAAGGPAGADGWGAPTTLWSSEAAVGELHLAVGPRGHAVAAWIRHDGEGGSVTMAAIRSRGGRWLPVQEVGRAGPS
jgi:hypothetical protein